MNHTKKVTAKDLALAISLGLLAAGNSGCHKKSKSDGARSTVKPGAQKACGSGKCGSGKEKGKDPGTSAKCGAGQCGAGNCSSGG